MSSSLSSLSISKSVGEKGINQQRDTLIIQSLLNTYGAWKKPVKLLKTDGRYGKNTKTAIYEFQKQAVGLKTPDTRVDPNGKTFRYLTMYLKDHEQITISGLINSGKASIIKPKIKKTVISQNSGLHKQAVTYKGTLSKDKHIVSEYSKSVIKMALKESGMTHAVITSTLRTPKEQAEIMLKNAKLNLKDQFKLYGANGDKVLSVYKKNKSKKDSELITLMENKILELAKDQKRVSKHCVTKESYLKTNVIDIGMNSTSSKSKNFNAAKFTSALKSLEKDGYIDKFIDETKKVNKAWHVEIIVGSKPLSILNPNQILNPQGWC